MIIKNERAKQAILVALADKEIMKILDCALFQLKSVTDIIRECDIPHTTAYRKIKWLLAENLLVVDKIEITPDGKKFSLFRSVFKSISVHYDMGSTVVEAEESFDIVDKVTEKFFSLE
ncbi:MAG: helix-turn-helix transcriptional regulator [Thaumarchaeota archaeon]|nr:helix-turn-helix transcriptional regulator [Nitrososphaerota archaeon]